MSGRIRAWLRGLMPAPLRDRYHRYALRRDFGIGAPADAPRRSFPDPAGLATGITVIGYFRSASGVGESARGIAAAAEAAGLPVQRVDVAEAAASRRAPGPYDVNLYHVNADAAAAVVETLGARLHAGRRNVGYWYWESDRFPAHWVDRFHYFDEIWVASEFCRRAVASVSPIPVHRVPPAVLLSDPGPREGAAHGKIDFLTVLDALSGPERKNPVGTIRAFAKAFPRPSAAVLRVQVQNARKVEGLLRDMREAGEGADVRIEDAPLSAQELASLFSSCDAYVSLHRCEGFGFPLAEAMALGKAVVATDYSGSTDFLDETTGFPVRWKPRPLAWPIRDYEAGTLWAEPDEAHAVETLQRVAADAAERKRRGEAARRRIRELYAPERAGQRIAARLTELRARAGIPA